MSAASGRPSKGPSQVAYGIALAAALSVEDPFMQTDNLQVSLMVMRLGSGRLACPSACAPWAPAQECPVCGRQVSVPTLLSMPTLQQAEELDEAMPHQRWNLQACCWP